MMNYVGSRSPSETDVPAALADGQVHELRPGSSGTGHEHDRGDDLEDASHHSMVSGSSKSDGSWKDADAPSSTMEDGADLGPIALEMPQTNGVLHHVPPIPSSPAPTRHSSASNDTFPGFQPSTRYLSNGKSPSDAPRRPSMHPQISRLRSTTQQRFPSNSSYSTALDHFDDTVTPDHISRRSSTSNIFEAAQHSDLPTPTASSQGGTEVGTSASETFKWSQLKRVSMRIYPPPPQSGSALASSTQSSMLGAPTVLAVSGLVAVGTAKGWAMVFDFNQNLRCVCGTEGIVKEAGAVTAIAISQDHTFIAVGHQAGFIHLYDLRQPNKPTRSVAPTSLQLVLTGRKEGHLAGSRILHLGFVGVRHTAIVSSDDKGLAFYHSLGKVLMLASTDIIRMLGRYPDAGSTSPALHSSGGASPDGSVSPSADGRKTKRPSTILDMAPLPLGPAPHPSDFHSLVALLTPTKLVVVGLKPTPRTWWRAQPAKDGIEAEPGPGADFATSGVLSWWPSATKEGSHLTEVSSSGKERLQMVSGDDPWLAFAFGRRVRLLRVRHGGQTAEKGSDADFAEEGSFESEQTVLGLRWHSARVLFVLTPHHVDVWDVNNRTRIGRDTQDVQHVVSHNHYRASFEPYRHKPMLAAYSSSFVLHKKKLFVLTTTDIRVAALLSWADRILNLMQPGTILEAIEVATAYLLGQVDSSTLTLPDDIDARRDMVEPRVRDILSASLDFVFSEERLRDGSHSDGETIQRLFEGFVGTCVRACIATGDVEWLFDELYERYEQNGIESIFLDRIEPFVLVGAVHALPPSVSQRLIAIHDERGEYEAAQRIIWHVDPEYIDINQALRLCQREKLYDALIYVYARSMHDFVAPLVELIALIREVQRLRNLRPRRVTDDYLAGGSEGAESMVPDAYKIFAYLSKALVGLSYPSGDPLPDKDALLARNSIYAFLFSPQTLRWPAKGGDIVYAALDSQQAVLQYPYLRLLLAFDSEAMLDALDLAFEDPYLDDEVKGKLLDRQQMLDILLRIALVSDSAQFSSTDRTFVRIFIARNMPKYPQYIRLRSDTLQDILDGLASDGDQSTTEDRQLAAEYLLSVFSPQDGARAVELFERAGFFRILRSIYRGERRWAALASTYLRDEDVGSEVFRFLADTLKSAARASTRQKEELASTILEAVPSLLQTDESALQSTAELFDLYMPTHHRDVLDRLSGSTWRQFAYLRCLLEPAFCDPSDHAGEAKERVSSTHVDRAQRHQYLELLCAHEPINVIRYLDADSSDLASDPEAIEICEKAEAYDAVIWSLDNRGDTDAALSKVDETLETRTDELASLMRGNEVESGSSEGDSRYARADALLEQINSVSRIATQICAKRATGVQRAKGMTGEDVWYRLLASLVSTVRTVRSLSPAAAVEARSGSVRARRSSVASIIVHDLDGDGGLEDDEEQRLAFVARASEVLGTLIPAALSTLVSTTSSREVSFPQLVRRLIESNDADPVTSDSPSSSSPGIKSSYAEFRTIVSSMLDTYAFESDLLRLTTNIVSQDLFEHVEQLALERDRGWRPAADICHECARPVWGPAGHGSSPLMSRSASVSMVVETMGMSGRPRIKKRPSLKGKEVVWPPDAGSSVSGSSVSSAGLGLETGSAATQLLDPPNGIVVARDGRVLHQSCHLLSIGHGAGQSYRMRRETSLQ